MKNRKDELQITIEKDVPIDPGVILPADVQATIARGEAALSQARSVRIGKAAPGAAIPKIITSVVDKEVQDSRDAVLDARERKSKGNRQQPPMIGRLRAVVILVDSLESDGVPFGVGPNSKMNKAVHSWLNARAEKSADPRKSRQKAVTQGAVRELLKQVRSLRP
jgi:hypothetical protein